MTNCALEPLPELAPAVRLLLTENGIEDLRGVEILRLVRHINNAYDSILAEHVQDDGVTIHRWRVLWRIWLEEQLGRSDVNPTLLSRCERVSKNTISDHLRGLEEAGLIERALDPTDRRQFKIGLTAAGRDLVVRSMPLHLRQMNRLLEGFSAGDVAQLHALLTRLQQTILTNAAPIASNQ